MLHLPARTFTFLANACEPSHPISQMNRLRIRDVTRLSQSQEGRALRQPVIWGFPSVKEGNKGAPLPGSCHKTMCDLKMRVWKGRTRLLLKSLSFQRRLSAKWLFEQLTSVSNKEAPDTR